MSIWGRVIRVRYPHMDQAHTLSPDGSVDKLRYSHDSFSLRLAYWLFSISLISSSEFFQRRHSSTLPCTLYLLYSTLLYPIIYSVLYSQDYSEQERLTRSG